MTLLATGVATVRPVEPAELPLVSTLLATSVHPNVRGLVPYHASGFEAFLAAATLPPVGRRALLLRGVTVDGEIVAVADWRVRPPELTLAGLAVRAGHQHRDHGRRLLDDGAGQAVALGLNALSLHVTPEDPRAFMLYHNAGFVTSTEDSWVDVPFRRGGPVSGVRLLDWPSYAANWNAYGFADCAAVLDDGTVHCVQVVGEVLRVGPEIRDNTVSTVLAELVGARRICTVLPGPAPHRFATFLRMVRRVHR